MNTYKRLIRFIKGPSLESVDPDIRERIDLLMGLLAVAVLVVLILWRIIYVNS